MILDTLAGLFLDRAKVTAVVAPDPAFRLIDLSLAGARFSPGQKLQIRVGTTALRTYSPFQWSEDGQRVRLVAYLHGETPAAAKLGALKAGDELQYFGPRGSLDLRSLSPIVLFGDETAFGVAASLGDLPARIVFEVTSVEQVCATIAELGLQRATLIERLPNDAHLAGVASMLADFTTVGARLVFTGRARSTQQLRAALKQKGDALAGSKVRAYWAEGKIGLD